MSYRCLHNAGLIAAHRSHRHFNVQRTEVKADWNGRRGEGLGGHKHDLPGLVTEAETVEALQRKLATKIRELSETDGTLDAAIHELPLNQIAHREAAISIRH